MSMANLKNQNMRGPFVTFKPSTRHPLITEFKQDSWGHKLAGFSDYEHTAEKLFYLIEKMLNTSYGLATPVVIDARLRVATRRG